MRGEGYEEAILSYARDCMDTFGQTLISRHESITGEALYFKGTDFETFKIDEDREMELWCESL